ncbi:MAG: shikimate dehydrogenase [Clostridia bacterium]|nr:shikimate dehydrogenase [Clostridia bacterium]
MKYGLIGGKLGHSFSKIIHERIADYEYELREIASDEFDGFMRKREFLGINVTIPYKESVIPYLDEVDEGARQIGAVNTVVSRDGKLYGYNTDYYGMSMLFSHAEIDPKGRKVAILGTGGTSKTAMTVVKDLGASEVIRVSRSGRDGAITYEELREKHFDTEIIVNTTPAGMFPNIYESPIDISGFNKLSGVIDAVYNPINTTLVQSAEKRGIKAEGGLYMLVAQAIRASELFTDIKCPSYMLDVIYESVRAEKENIVLIGMPSSGKSTVGRLLAQKLCCDFVDTDELILDEIKMPIKEFFSTYGEEKFRDIESEVIRNLAGRGGLVIATGGGAVLREENVCALKYNGKIIFIDRPLENLVATDSRPLSADRSALERLYYHRYPIYQSICDAIVPSVGEPSDVADNIVENYL